MHLILVRHAESVANAARINEGWAQSQLTARGREQAQLLAERLAQERIDIIYASDLRRVQETLAPLRRLRPDIPVINAPELREQGMGIYEGTPYGTMLAAAERAGAPYFLLQVQGGETIPEMHSRVRTFVTNVLRQRSEGTVCFYLHGGPLAGIALDLLGLPEEDYQEWYPENAHYDIFSLEDGKARCLRRNAAP